MPDISEVFGKMDLHQLRNVMSYINNLIIEKSRLEIGGHVKPELADIAVIPDVNDYVEYHEDYCNTENIETEILMSELESLGFKSSSKSVQNKFLSMVDESYSWKSHGGTVSNDPASFDDYPTIKSILEGLNSKFDINLNSVLISYYSSGVVNTRLHDDNEDTMDPTQPISVLSIGTKRRIEFFSKHVDCLNRSPDLAIQPVSGSLYVMKPGCQANFLHRVRKNKNIRESRFCLSFRCFVSKKCPTVSSTPAKPEPDCSSTPAAVPGTEDKSSVSDTVAGDVVHDQTPTSPKMASNISAISDVGHVNDVDFGVVSEGYSSFPSKSKINSTSIGPGCSGGQRICVLFGTSITADIDGEKMSRKNRVVVNRSNSGAYIQDVMEELDDFLHEHSDHVRNIDKIIFSIGTNEIKNFNCYKQDVFSKFYSPLMKLVEHTRNLFPRAQIVFQCVLPIFAMYRYTGMSIHLFNELLIEVCRRTGCVFFDCFRLFLNNWGSNFRAELYRDKLHLSKERGIGVLCRALKNVIFGNIYNPLMRCHVIRPYYYL